MGCVRDGVTVSAAARGAGGDESDGAAAGALRNPAGDTVAGRSWERSCVQCGAVFTIARTGRPRRFCSPACRMRAGRARARGARMLGPHPFWADAVSAMHLGRAQDVLELLPERSVQAIVTSPPYFNLRDYDGHPDQLGAEPSVGEYVQAVVGILEQARRVLRPDGTLWLNLGDTYANRADASPKRHPGSGHRDGVMPSRVSTVSTARPKSAMLVPSRVAIALMDAGWIVRNDNVWHKPNAMPESVEDRFSRRYEHLFMLSQSERYYFDLDAVRVPQKMRGQRHEGRSNGHRQGWPSAWSATQRQLHPLGANPGDVWSISTRPSTEEHYSMFPPEVPQRCILAGTRPGDVVLDPFAGLATTGLVAKSLGRRFVGIELVGKSAQRAADRLAAAPFVEGGDGDVG